MNICGHCGNYSVARKTIHYEIFVKNVGQVVINDFPMLVCHNSNCNAQWISGDGDQLITEEAERIIAERS